MGTLRITIELDTDEIAGRWSDYTTQTARQLISQIETGRAAIWPYRYTESPEWADWTEYPVVILPWGSTTTRTIGRILIDRSATGWAEVPSPVEVSAD